MLLIVMITIHEKEETTGLSLKDFCKVQNGRENECFTHDILSLQSHHLFSEKDFLRKWEIITTQQIIHHLEYSENDSDWIRNSPIAIHVSTDFHSDRSSIESD